MEKMNNSPLRALAVMRLLYITPQHLRRHLLSALGETPVNGKPSMFQCTITDEEVIFRLAGVDLKEFEKEYSDLLFDVTDKEE